jgi:hypothetical protein
LRHGRAREACGDGEWRRLGLDLDLWDIVPMVPPAREREECEQHDPADDE